MKLTTAIVFVLMTALFLCIENVCAETIDHREELEKYTAEFLKIYPKRLERVRAEAIPAILKYSEIYKVDPLLVACIISFESSWRPRDGDLKEAGYMQLMRTKWASRFNLETTDGQIHAGIARLKMAFDKCGTVKEALTHYASGSCRARTETTREKIEFRAAYYRRLVRRFRG